METFYFTDVNSAYSAIQFLMENEKSLLATWPDIYLVSSKTIFVTGRSGRCQCKGELSFPVLPFFEHFMIIQAMEVDRSGTSAGTSDDKDAALQLI